MKVEDLEIGSLKVILNSVSIGKFASILNSDTPA